MQFWDFFARRGKSGAIIGDYGTNFVGAQRKIAEYIVAWNKEGIEKHLVPHGIGRKFNAPSVGRIGWVFERLVRSCKKTMYVVLGNKSFTEDFLLAAMCMVEQRLNARPLTPVNSDFKDLEAVTPNHFLLG